MNIIVTITWDPSTKLSNSNLINTELSLENGVVKIYMASFKKFPVLMKYLWYVYIKATNNYSKGQEYIGKQVKFSPKKGLKIYSIPVTLTEEREHTELIYALERIEKKHFIVSRNETVTNEEYCTFFGSSGGLWNIELCDYLEGSFIEEIRQTVYEMENGNPNIYKWTNVPSKHLYHKLIDTDPEFAEYGEKMILPLIKKFWEQIAQSGDIDLIKQCLTEIANITEKYKSEPGIESL